MHWITMSGIALIATGTFLTFFGQNIRNRFDDKHLRQSINEKTFQIDELVSGNNELLTRIDEYQKNLSGKDKIIQQLETQFGRPDVIDQEQIQDKQLEARDNGPDIPSLEQSVDKQTETVTQVIPEPDLNEVIAQARSLCEKGKYDEAYKMADDLRQKNPDFGLAYFVLGTIEMRKKHYNKGEKLLNRAVKLVMPNNDMAWALHNLGISAIRKKSYKKAKVHLEKAIELNSGMEKSRNALKLLNDYLRKEEASAQVKSLFEEGRYDEAYKIADDLIQKSPDFGPAYFVLGTIELRNNHYSKGEDLLNKAVNLGLPDEDMAWALHNLGISSLRKKDYVKARNFLEKAIRLKPDMEESQKALESLDSLQREEEHGKKEKVSKSKKVSKGKKVSGSKKVSKIKKVSGSKKVSEGKKVSKSKKGSPKELS